MRSQQARSVRRMALFMLAVMLVSLVAVRVDAQTPDQPLVVFMTSSDLQLSSAINPQFDGLVKLNAMFQNLGASTQTIAIDEPIPEEAQVVVLVRPRRRLPTVFVARLWVHLQRGHHVLIALDPNGQSGVNTEQARDGLMRLFDNDYGIGVTDALVAEPWFTRQAILNLDTTYSLATPEQVSHPVIAPLATYEVPVQTWGARVMRVEPFGLDSFAVPLLWSPDAYAEYGRVFDQRDDPVPLEFTPEEDARGWLNLAALAENTATGSRIAVLGDSEILQNLYGLAYLPDGSQRPLHVGDWVLAERLAAWLLGLPEESWPELPIGITWLAMDGDLADWQTGIDVAVDLAGDAVNPAYDLQQVHIFQNDDYLYVAVETQANPEAQVQLRLEFDTNRDSAADHMVLAGAGDVLAWKTEDATIEAAPDGRVTVGAVIEARVPLRVTGVNAQVTTLCLVATDAPDVALDCLDLDEPVRIPVVFERAPSDLRFPGGMLVTIEAQKNANLRESPNTNANILTFFPSGAVLQATGRTEDGEWIQVRNARFSGWMAEFLLVPNGDLSTLPVIENP